MSESRQLNNYFRIGIGAIVIGVVTSLVGSLWAHFTGLPDMNSVGAEIYPAIPRGWGWVMIGQVVSLSGAVLAMGGAALAFLYEREVTWARASIGAALFTALTMILFGIIPNQWLTLTQATFAWTPQTIAFTIPEWLLLNNEVSISYAVIKDVVSGTYSVVVLGAVLVGMYLWQGRAMKAEKAPPPDPVSAYGRPLTKVER